MRYYIYEGVLFRFTRLVHILKLAFLEAFFVVSIEEINRIRPDMIQLFPKFRI